MGGLPILSLTILKVLGYLREGCQQNKPKLPACNANKQKQHSSLNVSVRQSRYTDAPWAPPHWAMGAFDPLNIPFHLHSMPDHHAKYGIVISGLHH